MFLINTVLMAFAVLYTSVRLEWRTNSRQSPFSEVSNKFLDFFDYNHLVDTAKVMCKNRLRQKRTYLLMLILMMALYTFQRDERDIMYMYCQLVFNWNIQQFSKFRTVQSGLQAVMLLIAIPVMSRLLGLRDTVIIMIGAIAHTAARIFYVTAQVPYVFYIGMYNKLST